VRHCPMAEFYKSGKRIHGKRFRKAELDTVTHEVIDHVADRMVRLGMPLRYALALERKGLTPVWWSDQLEKDPGAQAYFDEQTAAALEPILDEISKTTLKTMPAKVWLLERRFRDFSQQRDQRAAGNATQVNVQVSLPPGAFADARKILASPKQLPAPKPDEPADGGIDPPSCRVCDDCKILDI